MGIRNRLAVVALVSIAALSVGALVALASSHREAPGIANYPALDNTDLYAFVSPDRPSTVTFISNWWPFAEPSGGPNFYAWDDDAVYTIAIDNVGDARDHIVYEFRFRTDIRNGDTFLYNTGPITSLDDADWNLRQYYSVTRWENGRSTVLGRDLPVAPARVGDKSTPDYPALARAAVRTLSDGSRVFVGPRDDPFFVDLGGTFDLLTIRRVPGNQGFGVDGLGGFNVLTIALQVPKRELTRDGRDPSASNAIIGVYSTTERDLARGGDAAVPFDGDEHDRGRARRTIVSRLGSPLVNEVVIPLKDKDRWNRSSPRRDAQFLDYVVRPELSGLLNALYGISVPGGPRNDLVAVFLTGVPGLTKPENGVPAEYLRLNLSIPPSATPNRLGVLGGDLAGFPNGRRLADDVVDIELRAVAGVLVDGFDISPNNQLGDGVDVNDRSFLASFPYAATPHNGLSHGHHRREPEHPAGLNALAESTPGEDEIVEVESQDVAIDEGEEPGLKLAGPNPALRHEMQYTLDRAARVSLKIYDLQGREVRSLVDRQATPGTFETAWDGLAEDGSRAGKGVFFARFAMDGTVVNIRKLVVR